MNKCRREIPIAGRTFLKTLTVLAYLSLSSTSSQALAQNQNQGWDAQQTLDDKSFVHPPNDISEAVKLAKSGQIHYKAEKNGIVQAGVGKLSFGSDKICQNIESFVENIKKSKPSGSKGTFIKKISISSTMGVSLNCEVS